jgi:mRNA-degrading endonuclease RelE of RelBE toxin-antitoxin system
MELKLATVVSTDRFDAKAEKLLTPNERADLEFSLAKDPEAHPLIPALNGVRKARWGKQSTGKRGGVRVIYFYAISAEVVLLLAIYAKNEREDLTSDQKKQINRFVEAYKASF